MATVYLIGAGPGDRELITLKAKRIIEEADVLIYDYLANKEFTEWAKPTCEKIYVGKMGGNHTLTQDEINALIVRKGKEGKIIARLKGGDPFLFGRGGEEAEELLAEGISYEVIPGVTAGIAVPAYSGIPVTHRKFTSNVTFITGHEDPTKDNSNINWEALAGIGTLVFYMGVRNLGMIAKNLMKYGKPADTPVAVIRWGTTPRQWTITATLETIEAEAIKQGAKPPSIIIVGGVVSLKETLDWFEKRPLFGKKAIVTRSRKQASAFAARLEQSGAEVLQFPTIETVEPESWEPVDRALTEIAAYHWLIFTSPNGVDFFLQRLKEKNLDIRSLAGLRLAAIGPVTAKKLQDLSLNVDVIPGEYVAEDVIRSLKSADSELSSRKILLARATEAREIIPDELRNLGATVDVVPVYRTMKPKHELEAVIKQILDDEISLITFTSSSTVKNFIEMFDGIENFDIIEKMKHIHLASIGPITTETIRSFGLEPEIQAATYTIPGLTEAIEAFYTKKRA